MLLAGSIMCMDLELMVALNNTEAMLSELGKIAYAQCHVFFTLLT